MCIYVQTQMHTDLLKKPTNYKFHHLNISMFRNSTFFDYAGSTIKPPWPFPYHFSYYRLSNMCHLGFQLLPFFQCFGPSHGFPEIFKALGQKLEATLSALYLRAGTGLCMYCLKDPLSLSLTSVVKL